MSVASTTALPPTHASPLRRLWALPARTTDYTANARHGCHGNGSRLRRRCIWRLPVSHPPSGVLARSLGAPAMRQWPLPLVDTSQLTPHLQVMHQRIMQCRQSFTGNDQVYKTMQPFTLTRLIIYLYLYTCCPFSNLTAKRVN